MQGHDGALYLFYTGSGPDGNSVRLARSTDPLGRPGSWYKYFEGAGTDHACACELFAAAACHRQLRSTSLN